MASNQSGTCTVTPGLSTVTFSTNTSFVSMAVGDLFRLTDDIVFYTIASINSVNYQCTLSSRYSNSSFVSVVLDEVLDTGDGSATYYGTLANIPVIPGSASFADGSNVETFSDDGAGVLTGNLGGSGVINYETGVVSLTFDSVVPVGVPIYCSEYEYGIPLTSMPFQIVRDYTTNFNWPEPNYTDADPHTIIRQAFRLMDSDLYSYGTQVFNIVLFDRLTSINEIEGLRCITIPYFMNNYVFREAIASVYDKGVTGSTIIQITRRRNGVFTDLLIDTETGKISIGDEYFARDGSAIEANRVVLTGDEIYIDVDSVHSGTAPKGLSVTLTFQKDNS